MSNGSKTEPCGTTKSMRLYVSDSVCGNKLFPVF